jgi:hypothetical protein
LCLLRVTPWLCSASAEEPFTVTGGKIIGRLLVKAEGDEVWFLARISLCMYETKGK